MKTLIDLLENSAQKYANNPYLLEKKPDRYEATTYKETKEQVYKVAAGFLVLGIRKGDRIALISEGRTDWVISELGILYTGAVNIPLSIMLKEGSDLKFRLEHSESRWLVISGNQLDKVKPIRKELKNIEKIIFLDPQESYEKDEIFMGDVKKMGEEYLGKNREKFLEIMRSVGPDDYANICYTSGTTADPKGIILTHKNYMANIKQSLTLFSVPPEWTTPFVLPWDHAFAHTCGIYTLMSCGASMASLQVGETGMETLKNIPINIKEIRPHFLMSVPTLAKSFRKNIEKGIRDKGKLAETLFRLGLGIAYAYNGTGRDKGKGLRFLLKPLNKLFDSILFSKVRQAFGGRLKFFVGGGALLDIDLQRFFYAIGIPMYQGYGLTEAAPVISANSGAAHKLGSSGRGAKGMELRICDASGTPLPVDGRGEIVIRGENVMAGYWKNERATRETLKNGWLYTGDIGYLDEDMFFYVLGREESPLTS